MMLRRKGTQPDVAFRIAGEMVQQNGEDCSYYEVGDDRTLLAVFDGCGGIGSRRYENYSGKTGAYVSSRAICGAVQSWFAGGTDDPRPMIDRALQIVKSYDGGGRGLRGSLHKDFPTTAVITTAQCENRSLHIDCMWAGDSRGYVVTPQGLHQLTRDDVSGEDALENLSDDGVLTNVISASLPFELHRHRLELPLPALVVTATDGCFGYLKTPMEFEYLLLGTLCGASSIDEWKTLLEKAIAAHAGDDYSLCLAGFGFADFAKLKRTFIQRTMELEKKFIVPLQEEAADVAALWKEYRTGYYQYCGK